MAKKIKCKLSRFYYGKNAEFEGEEWATPNLCWEDLRKVAPALCNGLRNGEKVDCVITQTAKGIKIERA